VLPLFVVESLTGVPFICMEFLDIDSSSQDRKQRFSPKLRNSLSFTEGTSFLSLDLYYAF